MRKLEIDNNNDDRLIVEQPIEKIRRVCLNIADKDGECNAVISLDDGEVRAVRNWLTKYLEEGEV